jgi:broad specificity phosphatase PhoE
MRLIIVRHGETVENRKKIMQGWIGGTLTRKGISQAKKVGKRLKKEKFDMIYCSDLKRAKDTCKEIKKYHPKTKVKYVKELRERHFGILEGKTHAYVDEYVKKHNTTFRKIRPKGYESRTKKKKRVLKLYRQMVRNHKGETVLWVTHGGPISTIIKEVLRMNGEKLESIETENAAVSIIEVDKHNHHRAKLVNCVKHL